MFTPMSKYEKVNQDYASWKSRKLNAYDSAIKNWEAAYKSPYNQSELLEAAGYNRNWLQGAANSAVDASPSYGYTPSDAVPKVRNDPFEFFLGSAMQGIQAFSNIKDTLAGADLKEAQASQIRSLQPFKEALQYFKILPQYGNWYGFDDNDMHYFETSPGHGVTITSPTPGSYGRQSLGLAFEGMQLAVDKSRLQKTYFDLNNKQQKYVNDNILPLKKELLDLEKDIMTHSKTAAEAEAAIAKKKKEIYERFGEKNAQQAYIREWFNMGTQALRLGLDAFTGIGRLRLGKGALDLGNRRESNRELDQQYQWLGDYSEYSGDRSILSNFLFDNLGW